METPKRKKIDNEGFIPRLCATENPATGNETIPLSDLKEPSIVSAYNADKLMWEFYEDEVTGNKTIPLSDVKEPSNVSACNADKSLQVTVALENPSTCRNDRFDSASGICY